MFIRLFDLLIEWMVQVCLVDVYLFLKYEELWYDNALKNGWVIGICDVLNHEKMYGNWDLDGLYMV